MSSDIDNLSPVIAHLADFDTSSGSLIERMLFNNRPIILFACLLITICLSLESTRAKLNASFDQMIPTKQPFIVNYLKHYNDLQSQGNAIRIDVEANQGTIIDAHYLKALQALNDQIYLLPNVDRSFMTSLWTPSTRWTAVTSDGLSSGPVIGQTYDGSRQQLDIVDQNIRETGRIGDIVSNDFRSSMIYVPLLGHDGLTGKKLDYGSLAQSLDEIRANSAAQGVTLHIIGFAMVVGDMINDIAKVLVFFAVSACVAATALLWYTRCLRSTFLVVSASIVAVVWLMGLLPVLGYDLTPYSVLVPFLVFAIGMSHGAQKMNGVMQDIGRGTHPLVAARYTFRRLFLAGFSALVCDAASFAVLLTIQITAIRQLALLASIGVAILIFTNLIMLPMLLSYTGVSASAATRSLRSESAAVEGRVSHPLWNFLDRFTTRRYALGAIVFAVFMGGLGLFVGRSVQIGDLNKGAPELRTSSQYNQDDGYINRHYSSGSDTLVVMVDTQPNACIAYSTLLTMRNLEWRLDQLTEVEGTTSLGSFAPNLIMLLTENIPQWFELLQNQAFLNNLWNYIPRSLANFSCSFDPIYVSLTDHKAATLTKVVDNIQQFVADPRNQNSAFKISLAGGNAGIEAATNIAIRDANRVMLLMVYSTVVFFCFVVFRSWRAVVCAVLPLILTSILAQALMVWLNIGVKVATLPVIALGVGIGVDYALYILGIVMKQLRAGATLSAAYHKTMLFTGKVVLLTGFTLSAGVITWTFAPIKFQADMGLLLSFMFLWNMLGAMILLPSLAYFLLPPSVFANTSKIQNSASPNLPRELERTYADAPQKETK